MAHSVIDRLETKVAGQTRQKLTVLIGDFKDQLLIMDRTAKQETEDLNITLHQLDLTGTLGTFHPTTVEYTFLPSIHGTLLKMCHMLDRKPNFDKFKIIEFIQSIFFDYNGMRNSQLLRN